MRHGHSFLCSILLITGPCIAFLARDRRQSSKKTAAACFRRAECILIPRHDFSALCSDTNGSLQDQGQVDDRDYTHSPSSVACLDRTQLLLREARALRAEAEAMEKSLRESRLEKKRKEEETIDEWIERLLVNQTSADRTTQLLNTAEQVKRVLMEARFSPEQVDKIFERLCRDCPVQGRESVERSPLLGLIVEASGLVDSLEREENPNKRWNGRVERDMQKKLFAKEFGIRLEDIEQEKRAPRSITGNKG